MIFFLQETDADLEKKEGVYFVLFNTQIHSWIVSLKENKNEFSCYGIYKVG